MASNSLWFRQDAHELSKEWFFFLSAEARIGWMMLKAYVLEASVSQKRPGVAPALEPTVAAHKWRVSVEAIHELMAAATKAGEFQQNDAEWHVIDRAAFVSERTLAKIDSAEKPVDNDSEDKPNDVLQKNTAKPRKTTQNAEKVVACDTDTSTYISPTEKDSCVDSPTFEVIEGNLPKFDDWFQEFKHAYPKRNGALNVQDAEKKLRSFWKSKGFDADAVMAGVRRFRLWADATGATGTSYVPMMTTWVNQKRWTDEYEIPDDAPSKSKSAGGLGIYRDAFESLGEEVAN